MFLNVFILNFLHFFIKTHFKKMFICEKKTANWGKLVAPRVATQCNPA